KMNGRKARRLVVRHASECGTCSAAQAIHLQPRQLCPEGRALYAEWLVSLHRPARRSILRRAVTPLRHIVRRLRTRLRWSGRARARGRQQTFR
ncbi:MAG: hypothetical protein J2P45_32195, partial [Candidatus Dormibacteraeota bacterium]|nr:hypothetical protein [Candidatus Dormibacteraeota bacterium]